jgi:hypothetical protein
LPQTSQTGLMWWSMSKGVISAVLSSPRSLPQYPSELTFDCGAISVATGQLWKWLEWINRVISRLPVTNPVCIRVLAIQPFAKPAFQSPHFPAQRAAQRVTTASLLSLVAPIGNEFGRIYGLCRRTAGECPHSCALIPVRIRIQQLCCGDAVDSSSRVELED